jgi:hypothetical protein
LQDLALERPFSERRAGQMDEVDRALARTGDDDSGGWPVAAESTFIRNTPQRNASAP